MHMHINTINVHLVHSDLHIVAQADEVWVVRWVNYFYLTFIQYLFTRVPSLHY